MYRKPNNKQAPTRLLLSLLPEHHPAATRARAVIDEAREEVFFSLARYHADPERYGREVLREVVAGALELCAAETRCDLGGVLETLAADAELTPAEMANAHDGRTPWARRIVREARALRAAGRRIGREARA